MNFEMIEIDNIEEIEFSGKVYDFEVEDDHSYNVDGILVHNSDFVMLGSMFAGHNESGGEYITEWEHGGYDWNDGKVIPNYEEKEYKTFYGMSSKTANEKYAGGLREYRSAEGREVKVLYKGPASETVQDILGGLRSTMTYIGAKRLKDVPKCTTFIKVHDTHNRIFE